MNAIHPRKKSVISAVGAAVATAALPAFLFAGVGTAQAGTWAVPNGPGVPVYGIPFYLQENGTHDLWFPGVQTGTTWEVDVSCANGVVSPTQHVVY